MIETILSHALILTALFTAVPLAVVAVVGLLISVLQAATQIQEQSIAYLVKLGVLGAMLFVFGGLASRELTAFFQEMLSHIPSLGAM